MIALFAINVVLQVADLVLTTIGVGCGAIEGNPLWRYLLSRMSPAGVFSAMFGGKVFFLMLLWLSQSMAVNVVAAGIFAVVVAWNASVILRMAK